MSVELDGLQPSVRALVSDLVGVIQENFSPATFDLRVGPDGHVYLTAYTYAVNDFAIQDLVAEQALNAMIGSNIKVHVIPRRKAKSE